MKEKTIQVKIATSRDIGRAQKAKPKSPKESGEKMAGGTGGSMAKCFLIPDGYFFSLERRERSP